MLYFSELKGKKVSTEDGILVGFLEDLIFQADQLPRLTKLVVRTPNREKISILFNALIRIDQSIRINKQYNLGDLEENELFLVKNLLDKQIIDLKGHKVVRVNDVVIQDKEGWYISGVDIGTLAIFRWLKLDRLLIRAHAAFGIRIKSHFLSWGDIQPLELSRGKVVLKKREERLQQVRSEDLADYLERTNVRNIKKFLDILDDKFSADVISHLNINYQSAIFRSFTPEKAAKALQFVDADEAVDILLSLPSKKRQQIIPLLPDAKKQEIIYLLDLSKTPIGKLITSEYLTVDSGDTVGQTIAKIRLQSQDFSFLDHIYVVNQEKQLVGVFNLHELLIQNPDTPVYKFMVQNVIVVHLSTPEEIAIKKMLKYKIFALPVIDINKKMIGLITFDDVADFIMKNI